MSEEIYMEMSFDETAAEWVLNCFGKEVNDRGFVVDKDTKEKVLTPDGKEIPIEDFAGVVKGDDGSTLFIKDNFASIVEYVKRKKENDE